jgi:hypothetical protein
MTENDMSWTQEDPPSLASVAKASVFVKEGAKIFV